MTRGTISEKGWPGGQSIKNDDPWDNLRERIARGTISEKGWPVGQSQRKDGPWDNLRERMTCGTISEKGWPVWQSIKKDDPWDKRLIYFCTGFDLYINPNFVLIIHEGKTITPGVFICCNSLHFLKWFWGKTASQIDTTIIAENEGKPNIFVKIWKVQLNL